MKFFKNEHEDKPSSQNELFFGALVLGIIVRLAFDFNKTAHAVPPNRPSATVSTVTVSQNVEEEVVDNRPQNIPARSTLSFPSSARGVSLQRNEPSRSVPLLAERTNLNPPLDQGLILNDANRTVYNGPTIMPFLNQRENRIVFVFPLNIFAINELTGNMNHTAEIPLQIPGAEHLPNWAQLPDLVNRGNATWTLLVTETGDGMQVQMAALGPLQHNKFRMRTTEVHFTRVVEGVALTINYPLLNQDFQQQTPYVRDMLRFMPPDTQNILRAELVQRLNAVADNRNGHVQNAPPQPNRGLFGGIGHVIRTGWNGTVNFIGYISAAVVGHVRRHPLRVAVTGVVLGSEVYTHWNLHNQAQVIARQTQTIQQQNNRLQVLERESADRFLRDFILRIERENRVNR